MKKILFALALTVFMASAAWAAEEISYQSFWAPAHKLNRTVIEPWCKGMEEATKGKVVMHYNALNTLVKTEAMPAALKSGTLEAGGLQLQTLIATMPLSQLLGLPFLVQNAVEACEMAQKMREAFPEIRKEGDDNYHVLAMVGSDRYALGAVNGLIRTPADLVGKRVLVWATYQIEEVKAWGGLPVQVTSADTYIGLQRGLGEVAYVPFPAMESSKLAEVAKFITVIPSRTLPMGMVMNHDVWKGLPQDAKDYLNSTTGDAMSKRIGQALVELSAEDAQRHLGNGCTIHVLTVEEQAAFKSAAASANQAYWVDMLQRNNVSDPAGWIAKVEKLAADTFGR